MKTCVRCGVEKPLAEFHNSKRAADGRVAYCKACEKVSRDKYRLENPDAIIASDKKYKEKVREKMRLYALEYRKNNRDKYLAACRRTKEGNPKKYLLIAARSRARIKDLEFSITEDDIHIPSHCPVLGFAIKKSPENRAMDSPSIDRIDSQIGYIPGNVAVISYKANMIKSIGTAEDHEAVAKWMRNVRHGRKSNLSDVQRPAKLEASAFRQR